jgi:hypothetical protein
VMRSSKSDSVREHELTQYLLGNLHGEECERLDELSIADDEFAGRLRSAENDLVDAYVRGQLRGDALRDFESHYLATDLRRNKVAMARTLYAAAARLDASAESELPVPRPSVSAAENPRSFRWLPGLRFAWLAAAAMLVLSVTTVWLAVENHRLRRQDQVSVAEHTALEEELRQLRARIQNEQAVQDSRAAAAEDSGPQAIDHPERMISSIFLVPPTRGAAAIPVASMTETDRWLRLQLALESDDFSLYQINLMDLGSNRYVWHSGPVKSADVNHRRALSFLLPVGGLKSQRYAAEVSGIAADGRHEALGSYVFRIAQATSRQDERR